MEQERAPQRAQPGGQPPRTLLPPREAATAQQLDRLARAEARPGLQPYHRLNLISGVNTARGYRAPKLPQESYRKVQVTSTTIL